MLRLRLISGIWLLVLVVLVAYVLPAPCGWMLVLALALGAQHEFYGMAEAMDIAVFRWTGLVGGTAVLTATFWTLGQNGGGTLAGAQVETVVLAAVILSVFLRQLYQQTKRQPILAIACTLLGILYGPFLLHYMLRLAFAWHEGSRLGPVEATGRTIIFYLVTVVKASDVGAYFTGRFLGRHKMAPALSPNKTWEGVAGGVLLSLLVSLLFWGVGDGRFGILTFGAVDAIVLGLILPVVGMVGDLFESMLKRSAGVKDSGRLIPGMGGVLDVVDSLLFGTPVLYAYAVLFLQR